MFFGTTFRKVMTFMTITLLVIFFTAFSYKNTVTIDKEDGKYKTFLGLNDIFLESEDIVVYHIHGMGKHRSNEKEITSFYDKTAIQLGFEKQQNLDLYETLYKNNKIYGNMSIFNYKKGLRKFRVVSLSWSEIMQLEEDSLHVRSNPYENRVALANNTLKEFMNDGFGDAILYLNPSYKKAVHEAFSLGIDRACQQDIKLCKDKKVIVSSSLGSKILFDYLTAKLKLEKIENNLEDFFSNIEQVFMTSNQIPLIDLVNIQFYAMDKNRKSASLIKQDNSINQNDSDSIEVKQSKDGRLTISSKKRISGSLSEINEALRSFSSKVVTNKNRQNFILPIVAFSDPNDALSYHVHHNPSKDTKMDFTNVTLSYAKWWYFRILADPLVAHGGFMSSDVGVEAFIKGSRAFTFENYQ